MPLGDESTRKSIYNQFYKGAKSKALAEQYELSQEEIISIIKEGVAKDWGTEVKQREVEQRRVKKEEKIRSERQKNIFQEVPQKPDIKKRIYQEYKEGLQLRPKTTTREIDQVNYLTQRYPGTTPKAIQDIVRHFESIEVQKKVTPPKPKEYTPSQLADMERLKEEAPFLKRRLRLKPLATPTSEEIEKVWQRMERFREEAAESERIKRIKWGIGWGKETLPPPEVKVSKEHEILARYLQNKKLPAGESKVPEVVSRIKNIELARQTPKEFRPIVETLPKEKAMAKALQNPKLFQPEPSPTGMRGKIFFPEDIATPYGVEPGAVPSKFVSKPIEYERAIPVPREQWEAPQLAKAGIKTTEVKPEWQKLWEMEDSSYWREAMKHATGVQKEKITAKAFFYKMVKRAEETPLQMAKDKNTVRWFERIVKLKKKAGITGLALTAGLASLYGGEGPPEAEAMNPREVYQAIKTVAGEAVSRKELYKIAKGVRKIPKEILAPIESIKPLSQESIEELGPVEGAIWHAHGIPSSPARIEVEPKSAKETLHEIGHKAYAFLSTEDKQALWKDFYAMPKNERNALATRLGTELDTSRELFAELSKRHVLEDKILPTLIERYPIIAKALPVVKKVIPAIVGTAGLELAVSHKQAQAEPTKIDGTPIPEVTWKGRLSKFFNTRDMLTPEQIGQLDLRLAQIRKASSPSGLWKDMAEIGVSGLVGTAITTAVLGPTAPVLAPILAGAGIYTAIKGFQGEKPGGTLTESLTGIELPEGLKPFGETAEFAAMAGMGGPAKTVVKGLAKGGQATLRGVGKVIENFPLKKQLEELYKPAGEFAWKQIDRTFKMIPGWKRMFQTNLSAMEQKGMGRAADFFRKMKTDLGIDVAEITQLANSMYKGLNIKEEAFASEVMQGVGVRNARKAWKVSPARARTIITDYVQPARDMFHKKGWEAVIQDLLKEETFRQNINYLPRMYWTKEMKAAIEAPVWKRLPSSIRTDLHRFMKRKNIPEAIRQQMEEINQLSYLTHKGLSQISRDIQTSRLFRKIASNPDWAQEGTAKTAVKMLHGQMKGWKMLPTDIRLGDLSGMSVKEPIAREIQEVLRVAGPTERAFNRYFMTPWKYGKTVLRMATQVRNIMSNAILADTVGGLPIYRGDIYNKALYQVWTGKGPEYKLAVKLGLLDPKATWAGGELGYGRAFPRKKVPTTMGAMMRFATKLPIAGGKLAGRAYSGSEQWFKLAVFMHNLEKGLPYKDAAAGAMKAIFNYQEITPFVRGVKNYAMPFATFTYKALPALAEAAVKHPLRFAKYPLAMIAGTSVALREMGFNEKDWTKLKKILPEYVRRGHFAVLPYKDSKGRLQLWDLTYTLPWGDIAEMGQSGINRILQNPIITTAYQLGFNQNYAKQPIWYEHEAPVDKAQKIFSHIWGNFMPAGVPGGVDWEGISRALAPEGKKKEELDLTQALLRAFGGVKIKPIDPQTRKKAYEGLQKIRAAEASKLLREGLREHPSKRKELRLKHKESLKRIYHPPERSLEGLAVGSPIEWANP
jgi:hypothetical protein